MSQVKMPALKPGNINAPCCGRITSTVYLYHKGAPIKICGICRQQEAIQKKISEHKNKPALHS